MQGDRQYKVGELVVYKHCPGIGTVMWVSNGSLYLRYPEGHDVTCKIENCTPHTEPDTK